MQTILDIAASALDSSGILQQIQNMMSALSAASNLFFFSSINEFLNEAIQKFANGLLGRTMAWVGSVALVLMTIWIMIQGFRIVTGQSRDSMAALVMNSLKATLIVGLATAWGAGAGNSIFQWMGDGLQRNINEVVTGSTTDAYENIDRSLGYMQLAFTSIDSLQDGDSSIANDQKNRAMWFTGVGTGGPAITAGVMLLLNKIALALFTGLGPLFILSLLFEQTKQLFGKWLYYGIGTMFSLAVLSVMVGIALDVVTAVAASFWIGSFIGADNEGINSMAMQQGGLGLVLTMLIISAPPMAANFFQGTMGQFYASSWFGGGTGSQPGARVGESGYRGGTTSAGNSTAPNTSGGVRQTTNDGGRFTASSQQTATGATENLGTRAGMAPATYAAAMGDTIRSGDSARRSELQSAQTIAPPQTPVAGTTNNAAVPQGTPPPPKGDGSKTI
jgi:type IV secretion system protein VirB6